MGFEPMTSCLQDRRSNQLSYGALYETTLCFVIYLFIYLSNFPLLLCCVTFFLVLVRMSCLSFPGFLSICSTHSNFWSGHSGMIVVSGPLVLGLLPFSLLSMPACVSTFLCFSGVLSRLVVSAIFCATGAPPVSFVLLLVGSLSSIFEPFLHISCILGRFAKLLPWFRCTCSVLSSV